MRDVEVFFHGRMQHPLPLLPSSDVFLPLLIVKREGRKSVREGRENRKKSTARRPAAERATHEAP
jgi:hypothetical protein